MASESGWVHLYVERIITQTSKAFLIEFEKYEGHFWIPKSQIADPEEYDVGKFEEGQCQISITSWIAEQNGIDGE